MAVCLWALACILVPMGAPAHASTYVVGNTGSIGYDVVGLAFDPRTGVHYGTATGNPGRLLRIDPATDHVEIVGPLDFTSVQGLAFDPDLRVLYGSDTESGVLLRIDPATAGATVIGSLTGVVSLAFDPVKRMLYGVARPAWPTFLSTLLKIDPSTGTSTPIGGLALCLGGFLCETVDGLSWNGGSDTLYGAVGGYGVIRIDPETAAWEWIRPGDMGIELAAIAPASEPGVIFGATRASYLATVDAVTGSVTLAPAPGADFGDIDSALRHAQPGDVVLVMPGRYPSIHAERGVQVLASSLGPFAIDAIEISATPAEEIVALHGASTQSLSVHGADGAVLLNEVDVQGPSGGDWGLLGSWGIPSTIDGCLDVRVHGALLEGAQGGPPDGLSCCSSGSTGLWASRSRVELIRSAAYGGGGMCDWLCCGFGNDGWSTCSPGETVGIEAHESWIHAARNHTLLGFGTSAVNLYPGSNGLIAGVPDNVVGPVVVWPGASLRYSGVTIGRVAGTGTIISPASPDPTLELLAPYTYGQPLILDVRAVAGATVNLLVGAKAERVPTPGVVIDRLVLPLEEHRLGVVGADGSLRAEMEIPSWWPEDAWLLAQAEVTYPDGQNLRTNSVMTPTANTAIRFAAELLRNARDRVLVLSDLFVTTQGNRQALATFLAQAADHLQRGEFTLARERMDRAARRTDGCELRGAPDPRSDTPGYEADTIVNCDEQARVYPVFKTAEKFLESVVH